MTSTRDRGEDRAIVPPVIERDVPLAPLTTLELGGAADYFVAVRSAEALRDALRWAKARELPVAVLGGGSNLIVADEGYRGLVVHLCTSGIDGQGSRLRVAAGEDWDRFVGHCVERGFAGVECLAGIPGCVGATPIQNVGAYGQEVSETIAAVHVLERATLEEHVLSPATCAFAYRDSAFKHDPERYIVTAVEFQLEAGGAPARRYRELQEATRADADLSTVRAKILELRARKSMVRSKDDANRRSAGSFFTNPIVSRAQAEALVEQCMREGLIATRDALPRWDVGERVKIAAAWLIERAGFPRGTRRGSVGQSSAHALALVHHGGGTTAELLAYAADLSEAVNARFGVRLEREPRVLGEPG